MMDVIYDKKINNTYITLSNDSSSVTVEDYVERILLENQVPGFIKLISADRNNMKCVYDVTSYINIEDFVKERKIDSETISALIKTIIMAGYTINEYLIPYESVFFNLTFFGRDSNNIKFIIFPYDESGGVESLKNIADILIENVDYSDENTSFMAYEFYNMINNNNYEFEKLLDSSILNHQEDKTPENEYENDEEEIIEDVQSDTIYAIENNHKEKKYRGIAVVCCIGILLCLAMLRVF